MFKILIMSLKNKEEKKTQPLGVQHLKQGALQDDTKEQEEKGDRRREVEKRIYIL